MGIAKTGNDHDHFHTLYTRAISNFLCQHHTMSDKSCKNPNSKYGLGHIEMNQKKKWNVVGLE